MNLRKVSFELQSRVKKYVEYIHDEKKMGFHNTESALSCLSENFRDEIKKNIFSKQLLKSHVFKNNFSENFINQLSLKITEVTFTPDEKIFNVRLLKKKN